MKDRLSDFIVNVCATALTIALVAGSCGLAIWTLKWFCSLF